MHVLALYHCIVACDAYQGDYIELDEIGLHLTLVKHRISHEFVCEQVEMVMGTAFVACKAESLY